MSSDTSTPLDPGVPPFSFGPDDPNVSQLDLVTPQMCAAAHLDGNFANRVAGELITNPHRAVWPNWQVNYLALARHAQFSRERRALRNLELCFCMIFLTVGVLGVGLAALLGHVSWLATLLAILLLFVLIVGAAAFFVRVFFDETVDIVMEIMEDPAASARRLDEWERGLPTGTIRQVHNAMMSFRSWHTAWRHRLRGFRRQLSRLDDVQDHKKVGAWREYLTDLDQSNVMHFNRDFEPFALAGVPLDSWTITVDLKKAALSLKAATLHAKLLKYVLKHAPDNEYEPGNLLPNVTSRSVYVVSGMQPAELELFEHARSINTTVPEGWRLEHPDLFRSAEQLEDLIENPPEGGRVYAYFQKYSWRGHLVVGAAVRVYRAPRTETLLIEFNSHVLPPLSDGFNNMYNLPEASRNRRKALWSTVRAQTLRLLFQSPRAAYLLYFPLPGGVKAVHQLQEMRDEEMRIDYGSTMNLRLAAGDEDRMWLYPYVDELDFGRVIRDRVIDVVRGQLQAFLVPTSEFDEQVRIMRERKRNYDLDKDD